MSDYFSTIRDGLAEAVVERRHLRWYHRIALTRPRGRALVVVLAALALATPAVAAISGWFSPGKPDATGFLSAGSTFGVVKPGDSRMLPIRVADPQGGPPWGLRLVRTTGGNACLQLGRVDQDQLGSLGIDDAWDNDHRFHEIPANAAYADSCGSTDAAGHGYLNRFAIGTSASANPTYDVLRGPQMTGCRLHHDGGTPSWPYCPAGSNRMIFYGLLGPDATSVTYRTPNGSSATEPTVAGTGAYLIIYPYNGDTCRAYNPNATCNGGVQDDGISPTLPGAITRVTYRDGHSCSISNDWRHRCPPVGWVAFKRTHITQADVNTPIQLRVLDPARDGRRAADRLVRVKWSFTAREPGTTSHTWYSWRLEPPRASSCGGGEGYTTRTKIQADKILRYGATVSARCRGTYHLVITYTPIAPPDVSPTEGELAAPGQQGQILVGRTSFTVR